MDEVLLPVPADPTVSFSVSFRAGSQNDPVGKEGLAYLTGAMVAEAATKTRSYDEILAALYPLAADYEMTVDRELSTLTGRVHRDNLEKFSGLFTEALLEPAFETDDFERIRSDTVNYLENTLRFSSDEELTKALLYAEIFAGTRYAHPEQGTLAGLAAITLDDVRQFHTSHYTQANAVLGLGGSFDDTLARQMRSVIGRLPVGTDSAPPPISPRNKTSHGLVLIDKPGADASISIGFPLAAHRGERDFYALWIANSWLGEHRNSASHLFQVIREKRGLNYGDYSYIECFPGGGELQMPPVNVPRRQQIFEIWLRTLPVAQAPFAIKAALRELASLCTDGMSAAAFELTRTFLSKYSVHFADTTSARLGYAVDDRFYRFADSSLPAEGHLARFRRMMSELALDDVNSAVRRHLGNQPVTIAIVADAAPALAGRLTSGLSTPVEYDSEMAADILAEDVEIASFDLDLPSSSTRIVELDRTFAE